MGYLGVLGIEEVFGVVFLVEIQFLGCCLGHFLYWVHTEYFLVFFSLLTCFFLLFSTL